MLLISNRRVLPLCKVLSSLSGVGAITPYTPRPNLDLQTLHERTAIDRDLLRYCIDRKIVPSSKIQTAENVIRRPRQFDDVTALLIVCAARLIKTGLPPRKIREIFNLLLDEKNTSLGPAPRILQQLVEERLEGRFEYGDGEFIRLCVPFINFDSGWRHIEQPNSGARLVTPTTQIVFELGSAHHDILPFPE